MQKNVAMAMCPVGVHNFSCVLSSIRCTTKVVNSNLRNQLKLGSFEIASIGYSVFLIELPTRSEKEPKI